MAMDVREFLGLEPTHNPHRWVMPVTPGICTRAQFLLGGAGLGAAVAAMEATTGRSLVWATAQYLSYANPPSYLDLDVVVPVSGNYSTQARAVGHVCDKEILTVNAALGRRPFDVEGQWARRPVVPPPAECPPLPLFEGAAGTVHGRVELRVAAGRYGMTRGAAGEDGRSALWARIVGVEVSAAVLAIIADWMPSGLTHALGRWAGGNSLDNTIRILHVVPTEWVLLDIHVHGVRHGFGHGRVHLWSEDGHLMAAGSQSVIVRLLD
jgi:acyl-CoA thioesterase